MPKRATSYRIRSPRSSVPSLPRPLQTIIRPPKRMPPYGVPPPEFPGSSAEWAIQWALMQLGEDFLYQASFDGGRQQLGGTVVDFLLHARLLVIRVQGTYWHYERGMLIVNQDEFLKNAIESKGYVVIDIDDKDALVDPIYFVKEALAYRDHSKGTEL